MISVNKLFIPWTIHIMDVLFLARDSIYVENDRCEHRKSNIGKIGRHPVHRTLDCNMAPIPVRRLASLSSPACQ